MEVGGGGVGMFLTAAGVISKALETIGIKIKKSGKGSLFMFPLETNISNVL
jgi:hypothetical protein